MSGLFDLAGKTAIVTGGAGLIGSAACEALADHGANVVVSDVATDAGERLADRLGSAVRFVHTDVTDEESVSTTVERTIDSHGEVDVLVNCAYPKKEAMSRPFHDVPPDEWDENVRDHLAGHVVPVRQVSRAMAERGTDGSIVTFGSIYGVQAPDFSVYEGTEMTSPAEYATAKGAILSLTRHLASQLGPAGIRVNSISPGGVFDDQHPTFVEQYERRAPLGRMASPEDLAGAIVYLASDASSYVTGQNLVVDGGWTIQ